MSDKSLKLVSDPILYFKELVEVALASHRLKPSPETEFYLVNLLKQFMTTDRYFRRNADGVPVQEPLAKLFAEAIETPRPEEQNLLFRQLGDVSLYTAGYFQESLTRRLIDLDYYIEMGCTAYLQVAERVGGQTERSGVQKEVFEELAHRFDRFVQVIAEVSDITAPKSEKELVNLYSQWTLTKSKKAERVLKKAGITPSEKIAQLFSKMKLKKLQ